MATARDVMSKGAKCIGEDQSLMDAAVMMRDMGVGSLPICGSDDRLKGMITDRDIVLKCVAEGQNPSDMRAGDCAQGTVHWVDATADVDDALAIMREHQIKRLPVIEEHQLVGMISESDLSMSLDETRLSNFVEKVYAAH
ncbi:MAG: CBS domain-containing protein [Propionibacteriales bacterium]|nr:CBS domain-containing protein [Propionibacteriales bacterium]